jgi:hypothetical protein
MLGTGEVMCSTVPPYVWRSRPNSKDGDGAREGLPLKPARGGPGWLMADKADSNNSYSPAQSSTGPHPMPLLIRRPARTAQQCGRVSSHRHISSSAPRKPSAFLQPASAQMHIRVKVHIVPTARVHIKSMSAISCPGRYRVHVSHCRCQKVRSNGSKALYVLVSLLLRI